MAKYEILKLLDQLSMNIIDYEDGDLILLSELMDNISELNTYFEEDSIESKISNTIYSIFDGLIKGKTIENSRQIVSTGVDLLSRIVESTGDGERKLSEHILDEINSYFRSNKEYKVAFASSPAKAPGEAPQEEEEESLDFEEEPGDDTAGIPFETEVFKIFLTDTRERIVEGQELIMKLEAEPDSDTYINEMFRLFHTIKGESGFLKLSRVAEFTHSIENLLSVIRNHEMENSDEIIDLLLRGVDLLKDFIDALEYRDVERYKIIEIESYKRYINNLLSGERKSLGAIMKEEGKIGSSDLKMIIKRQRELGYTKKFGEIAVEEKLVTSDELNSMIEKQNIINRKPEKKAKTRDPIIKVRASQINYLVDMVAELLIAENQLEDRNIAVLHKITKQIQEAAMTLRTVKVQNLFINMKRLVRDVSKSLGKDVAADLIGQELEIDRNIVESLEEPLMHMLRNAISHGIESGEERESKGKRVQGHVVLKAERRGNNIVISVRDDGRGMDRDKILNKAVERGLTTMESALMLSDNEIYSFIFHPGFSTTEKADAVSGRGVGMDVVKSAMTTLRGRVEVDTVKDSHTEISLFLPLSMAIIEGMIVRVGINHFIIPVSTIIESLKLRPEMIHRIEDKETVINLRGEIIPAIYLNRFFKIESEYDEDKTLSVIVEDSNRKYALLVEEIVAKKEVVIKSLGERFSNLRGISSATVLSGRKIGFVLNVEELLSFNIQSEQSKEVIL